MSNFSVDRSGVVRNSSGQEVGKSDYSGNVTSGYHDRGKIVNDRYVDEYGRDHGWVSKSSSSGSGSGSGGGGGGLLLIYLVFGIYYGMYLGIKWLIDQGKISAARASRSWGIASILFPPFAILAYRKGKSAKKALELNGDPDNEIRIANIGIGISYAWVVFLILFAIYAATVLFLRAIGVDVY